MMVMREHQHAALGEHHIVVQLLGESLPEIDRVVVERRRLVEEIVRTDDGGVAAGIAAADPALFDDRDIGDAVNGRKVIGRRQPMSAAADDDDVVFLLRLRRAPLALPTLMTVRSLFEKRGNGKTTHEPTPSMTLI